MFVYILYSQTLQKYYTGQTQNLKDRLARHKNGLVKSTKNGKPWVLVHFIVCDSRSEAMMLEKRIKKRGAKRYLKDINIL
ncbi:GIY-YIG nuclease family protein [Flavobacteriaceae bacterium 14752]|uniref:GIY-YIG nuclease family protein n=1 Tax=Mesohalobacter salilacus TaxID=2491711 RepID=UPI000F634D05|nr:GIY-YIG nuclease family protein [Flavobacteriaceae bacterium 14752]